MLISYHFPSALSIDTATNERIRDMYIFRKSQIYINHRTRDFFLSY